MNTRPNRLKIFHKGNMARIGNDGLVERNVIAARPITVEYTLTPYSKTFEGVILAMESWGVEHRKK